MTIGEAQDICGRPIGAPSIAELSLYRQHRKHGIGTIQTLVSRYSLEGATRLLGLSGGLDRIALLVLDFSDLACSHD